MVNQIIVKIKLCLLVAYHISSSKAPWDLLILGHTKGGGGGGWRGWTGVLERKGVAC